MSDYAQDWEFERFDGLKITKEDIREDIMNYYINAQQEGNTIITDFNKGSEAYHLIDLLAELMMEIYSTMNDNLSNILIHEATGEVLDNFGDMRGVHRITGAPAILKLEFSRKEGVTGDIIIHDGTSVLADDSISFLVDIGSVGDDDYVVLKDGVDNIVLDVICTFDGTVGNLGGTSPKMEIEDSDLADKLEITHGWKNVDGIDDESDDDYRYRIMNASANYPVGSNLWYEKLAMEHTDECADVKVEYGDPDDKGLQCVDVWFKPKNYSDYGVVQDTNIPEMYIEDNKFESKSEHKLFRARRDLIYLLMNDTYKIVNHIFKFRLSEIERIPNLYLVHRVILADGYALTDEVIKKIREKAYAYSDNLKIGESFKPYLLNESIKELDEIVECKLYDTEKGDVEVYAEIEPSDSHKCLKYEINKIEEAVKKNE